MTGDSEPLALTTSLQTAYTCPANKSVHLTICQVANVHASNDVDITVQWTDASNANVATHFVKNGTLAVGDAINVVAGGMNLAAGDTVRASASANLSAELTLSYIIKDVV